MTTTTAPRDVQGGPRLAHTARLSFGGILRSEWIKLRSLRSTVWSYLIVVLISLGMAVLLGFSLASGMGGSDVATLPSAEQTLMVLQSAVFGTYFGQLVVAVLGVLVISGEYTTGMIRSTLSAVPKRLPALAGKAVVLFLTTFVVAFVTNLAAFGIAAAIFAGHGAPVSLFAENVLLVLGGAALYLALVSVFALGIGTVIRSSAGGIAAVLGVLLLLPTVFGLIPADWASDLLPYLLSTSGMTMYMTIGADPATLAGPNAWQSLLVVLGWVTVSIAAAAVLLKRRDA